MVALMLQEILVLKKDILVKYLFVLFLVKWRKVLQCQNKNYILHTMYNI